MIEVPLRVRRNEDEFHGDLYGPVVNSLAPAPLPALVFVPDILLSRRHGFYPWLCRRLAEQRLVLSVDAAGSGYGAPQGEGAERFPAFDEERARGYLLSRELQDLVHLVRSMARGELEGSQHWDGRHLCVAGHGKGAALALHLSRRLAVEGIAITSVLMLSPPSTLIREGLVADHSRMHVPVDVGPRAPLGDIVLGAEFQADARELAGMATLAELMSSCEAPVLLLCGEEDPVFGVGEAERLLRVGHSEKDQLLVVEAAGHYFGGAHPFEGPGAPLLFLLEQSERFLRTSEGTRAQQRGGEPPVERSEGSV